MKGHFVIVSEFGKVLDSFNNWLDAKCYLLGFCHCGWHEGQQSKLHPNGEVYTDEYNVKWYIKTDKELV